MWTYCETLRSSPSTIALTDPCESSPPGKIPELSSRILQITTDACQESPGVNMRFRAGQMALTIWGWTPGLCETVGGRVLACGCLVGKYETWNGQIVETLDGCCERCRSPHHTVNRVFGVTPADHPTRMRCFPLPGQERPCSPLADELCQRTVAAELFTDALSDEIRRL